MQSFATASVMELRNVLVLILLISGHYCVNAAEIESSDEKSVEENKKDSKSNYYLFLIRLHHPTLLDIGPCIKYMICQGNGYWPNSRLCPIMKLLYVCYMPYVLITIKIYISLL